MHREIIKSTNELIGYALDALAKGDYVTARRWLKTAQHDTSDTHIALLEQVCHFQQINGDLPSMEKAVDEAKGRIIDGAYTRGGVS